MEAPFSESAAAFMNQIRMLEHKLEKMKGENANLKSDKARLENTIKALNAQKARTEEEGSAKKEVEEGMERVLQRTLQDKLDAKKDISSLKSENEALKTALEDMTNKKNVAEAKYHSLVPAITNHSRSETATTNTTQKVENVERDSIQGRGSQLVSYPSTSRGIRTNFLYKVPSLLSLHNNLSSLKGATRHFKQPHNTSKCSGNAGSLSGYKDGRDCSIVEPVRDNRFRKRNVSVMEGAHGEDYSRSLPGKHLCICGTMCSTKSNLVQHIKCASTAGHLRCIFCNDRFHYVCHFKTHALNTHKIVVDIVQTQKCCQTCQVEFASRVEYEAHCMQRHRCIPNPPAHLLLEVVNDD